MGLPEKSVRFDNAIASVSDVIVTRRERSGRVRKGTAHLLLETLLKDESCLSKEL